MLLHSLLILEVAYLRVLHILSNWSAIGWDVLVLILICIIDRSIFRSVLTFICEYLILYDVYRGTSSG
ncbi:hypothetical protein D3C78_1461240 [compost metagenome]